MRVRAFGRIVSCEGASLWIFGTRPGEVYPRTSPHAHHAVQVTLALRGTVNLYTESDSYAGSAAAVAPDVSHTFQAVWSITLSPWTDPPTSPSSSE